MGVILAIITIMGWIIVDIKYADEGRRKRMRENPCCEQAYRTADCMGECGWCGGGSLRQHHCHMGQCGLINSSTNMRCICVRPVVVTPVEK